MELLLVPGGILSLQTIVSGDTETLTKNPVCLAGEPGFEPGLTESESFIPIHPSCKVTRGRVYRVGFHTAQSSRSLIQ
jgi:hypothetical protein